MGARLPHWVEGLEARTLLAAFLVHGFDATSGGNGGSATSAAIAMLNPAGSVGTRENAANAALRPERAASRVVAMAVADLTGDGSEARIFVDQGLDRVVVDYGDGRRSVVADRSTGLLKPSAVAVADLNGDGLADLIVADSGRDSVLIFPGGATGQFGSAIEGYSAGTNPVGITVANLTGSLPDLVIADRGSNEVSILINRSQRGGAIAFSPGARLNSGGFEPVSTLVGHFTGGPFPDILVTNGGSNTVALLPGIGEGLFDDLAARVFSVGSDPVMSIVGDFDGQADLVTLDAGSNSLTIISGFTGSNPVVTTMSSGGLDPTTAFTFDAGNGYQGLVVANGGDGVLALFEGGPEGLTLVAVEAIRTVPAPVALAFAAMTGGAVEFYAATAGRESSALVSMSLATPNQVGSSPGSPPPSAPPVQLVAASDTSLPLVATVLTLSVPVAGDEFGPPPGGPASITTAAMLAAPGTSAGQGPVTPPRPVGTRSGGSDVRGEMASDAEETPSALAPWERYVLGVDEAIDELGREGMGVLMDPSSPFGRAESPSPTAVPASFVDPSVRSVPGRRPVTGGNDPDRTSSVVLAHADDDLVIGREVAGTSPVSSDDAPQSAGSSAGGADRSTRPSRRHGLRVAPAGLALTLLAARWGAIRLAGRTGVAAGPGRPPVRRRGHGLI